MAQNTLEKTTPNRFANRQQLLSLCELFGIKLCAIFGIVSFRVIRRDVGFLIVFSTHLRPSSQVAHGRSGFRITKFRVKLGLEVVQYSLV